MSLVVSDTTPLNYLILIGEIGLLPRLFGQVLIPAAVIQEMRHSRAPASVAAWTDNLPAWAEIRLPQTASKLGIGVGEDEAIALALELGDAALLMDDAKGRAFAKSLGLLTIGTVSILDLADEAHLVDFFTAISKLQATNFRLEETLLQPVLAKVRARKNA